MSAVFSSVSNRGTPPREFIHELIAWGRVAPSEIFTPNNDPEDVYNRLLPLLGPWRSQAHRRAALLELLRCLAGFESSWNWNEGVDVTNQSSLHNIRGQETGIFQVSYDSLDLDISSGSSPDLHTCVLKYCGDIEVHSFIRNMKSNHTFALEYCARLLRNSYFWDGPIKRHEIDRWLSSDAVNEFILQLS